MTVAMLMQNTYLSAVRFFNESRQRAIVPLPLELLEPVPSDIAIALAQKPKPIKFIAEELGLLPNEVCFITVNLFLRLHCVVSCKSKSDI